MSLAFPLISFPYISRTLQPEGVGSFQFANSIISYFLLISGLGITTYAVREGSRFRKDPEKMNRFASEVYSMNLYSTLAAYVLLGLCILLSEKLRGYYVLLLILSAEMLFITLAKTWVYNIFEDFTFMALAAIGVQAAALIAMFLFVHSPADAWKYAWVSVLSYTGDGIFMHFYSRRYVKLHFVPKPPAKHWRPVFVVFAMTIGTTIYVSADLTLLGWICGDYVNGQYATAASIYKIVKGVLVAVIMAVIPRFSYFVGKALEASGRGDGEECRKREAEAKKLADSLLESMLVLCLPAMVGLFCMSEAIVGIFAGDGYARSVMPLRLLSLALVFAVFETFYASCILISYKKEMVVMRATFISAGINVVLNLLLIPLLQENAAAVTTIAAEIVMLVISRRAAGKVMKTRLSIPTLLKTLVGCALIAGCCIGIHMMGVGEIPELLLAVPVSILLYGITELLLKNPVILQGWKSIRKL